MRLVDLLLVVPFLVVLLVLSAYLGQGKPLRVGIILALLIWVGLARIVRGVFLSLREKEFVEAAKAAGAGDLRIMFRHMLPSTIGPIVVTLTLLIAAAILIEAALSFLGFGVQPPTPALGKLIADGQGEGFWVLVARDVPRDRDRARRPRHQLRRRRASRCARPHAATACLRGGELVPDPILELRNLTVEFATEDGVVHAVTEVSYDLHPGEILGIVGESGSGKSVSMLAVLGLIPMPPGRIASGEALYKGKNLLEMPKSELRKLRGGEIAMIFQDPMTCLNPVLTIGYQISEAVMIHNPGTGDGDAMKRAVELLDLVGVPYPERRVEQYPHEFSGGMRQRAMIAMAIANNPSVLVADEPTTALDVTIQAQIVEVLKTAQRETHAATVLITHDLGLIAELADRVVVMYAGRVVELGDVYTIFNSPAAPVHHRADEQSRAARYGPGAARAYPGPAAEHGQSTAGLRLPPALRALAGARSVQDGHSGAADIRRGRRAPLRLPLRR